MWVVSAECPVEFDEAKALRPVEMDERRDEVQHIDDVIKDLSDVEKCVGGNWVSRDVMTPCAIHLRSRLGGKLLIMQGKCSLYVINVPGNVEGILCTPFRWINIVYKHCKLPEGSAQA